MPLSQSFPTVGRLISKTRRLFSKSTNDQNGGVASAVQDLPQEAHGTPDPAVSGQGGLDAYDPGLEVSPQVMPPLRDEWPQEEMLTGEDLGQDLVSGKDETLTMSGLYETWVELEQRVKQAQNELQAILATRE